MLISGFPVDYTIDEINVLVMKHGLQDKVILQLDYISDDEMPLYYYASDGVIFPYASFYTGGSGPLMKGACTYALTPGPTARHGSRTSSASCTPWPRPSNGSRRTEPGP